MTNRIKNSLWMLVVLAMFHCRSNDARHGESKDAMRAKTVADRTSMHKEFGERMRITGDFNGDNTPDILSESYISQLTGRETYRVMDTRDPELDRELLVKNKPLCRILVDIPGSDTLLITDESQQAGLYLLENIGDLDDDGGDEFGYIVNWTDNSTINRYHVGSLKHGKFVELLSFSVNENLNFEPTELLDGKSVIQKLGFRKIRYRFYSDTSTIETGEYTFY